MYQIWRICGFQKHVILATGPTEGGPIDRLCHLWRKKSQTLSFFGKSSKETTSFQFVVQVLKRKKTKQKKKQNKKITGMETGYNAADLASR